MTKVLTLEDLKEIEVEEYKILKSTFSDDNHYRYYLGRWGIIRELIEKMENENE